MTNDKPIISQDPLYRLLRVDNVKAFNLKREAGQKCDLRGVDLRGLDLRGLNAAGLDLSDGYLRDADLRGIDFSRTGLEGASIRGAKISGCRFPVELTAEEIRLSWELGTRLRYNRPCAEPPRAAC